MSSSSGIPTTMQACQLSKYIEGSFSNLDEGLREYFSVEEVEVPKPKKGEVLVKIARSPINPSDLSSLKGSYDASGKPNLPFRPGFEGSGLVVASGGGMVGWTLVGKRVAIVAGKTGGIWAQYATVPATQCVAISDDISYETAASAFVNPWTVLAFLEIAHAGSHKYIVHTAGASALGKMLIKLGKDEGVQVIAVVRKDEQVEELKALGAADAFSTSADDWKVAFKQKCKDVNCTLAFDAVAGPLTGEVLHAMPKGSVIKVYGGLSEQLSTVSPGDLIFQNKKVEGFWLTEYIKTKSLVGLYLWQRKVKSLINTTLKSHVRATYTLDQVPTAVLAYASDMTAGKVLIAPGFLEEEGASSSSSGSSSSTTESEKKDKEKEGEETDTSAAPKEEEPTSETKDKTVDDAAQ